MVAAKKKPENRSTRSGGSSSGDDPRYIAVARGQSTRDGIPIPGANPKWKPEAQSWFRALKLSGQSEFFEASDWATAVAAAGAYDIFLRTYNGNILTQFNRMSERLGCTVIDRKKSRIELAEPEPTDEDEDAADEILSEWQGRLHSVPDRRSG